MIDGGLLNLKLDVQTGLLPGASTGTRSGLNDLAASGDGSIPDRIAQKDLAASSDETTGRSFRNSLEEMTGPIGLDSSVGKQGPAQSPTPPTGKASAATKGNVTARSPSGESLAASDKASSAASLDSAIPASDTREIISSRAGTLSSQSPTDRLNDQSIATQSTMPDLAAATKLPARQADKSPNVSVDDLKGVINQPSPVLTAPATVKLAQSKSPVKMTDTPQATDIPAASFTAPAPVLLTASSPQTMPAVIDQPPTPKSETMSQKVAAHLAISASASSVTASAASSLLANPSPPLAAGVAKPTPQPSAAQNDKTTSRIPVAQGSLSSPEHIPQPEPGAATLATATNSLLPTPFAAGSSITDQGTKPAISGTSPSPSKGGKVSAASAPAPLSVPANAAQPQATATDSTTPSQTVALTSSSLTQAGLAVLPASVASQPRTSSPIQSLKPGAPVASSSAASRSAVHAVPVAMQAIAPDAAGQDKAVSFSEHLASNEVIPQTVTLTTHGTVPDGTFSPAVLSVAAPLHLSSVLDNRASAIVPSPQANETSFLPSLGQSLVTSSSAAAASDSAQHATLLATPNVLEVGVANGSHGWLKVRAELDSAGSVSASLMTSSTRAAESMHKELPALSAYLSSESVSVSSLVINQAGAAGQGTTGGGAHDASMNLGTGTGGGGPARDQTAQDSSAAPALRDDATADSIDVVSTRLTALTSLPRLSPDHNAEAGSWLSVRA